jgi:hypothetical protein
VRSDTVTTSSRRVALPPNDRSEWVDVAKGLAIGLMVLGHVVGGLQAGGVLSTNGTLPSLYKWIYTFHMATFMLLLACLLSEPLLAVPPSSLLGGLAPSITPPSYGVSLRFLRLTSSPRMCIAILPLQICGSSYTLRDHHSGF